MLAAKKSSLRMWQKFHPVQTWNIESYDLVLMSTFDREYHKNKGAAKFDQSHPEWYLK